MTSRSRSSGSLGRDGASPTDASPPDASSIAFPITGAASGEPPRSRDRAAVEPIAALVALVAVGAALGLYTGALDEAAPDGDRKLAETTLDRVERDSTVGGVVRPDRIDAPVDAPYAGVAVELRTRTETWRVRAGDDPPALRAESVEPTASTAERTVTVRAAPGENLRGVLRVVVRR